MNRHSCWVCLSLVVAACSPGAGGGVDARIDPTGSGGSAIGSGGISPPPDTGGDAAAGQGGGGMGTGGVAAGTGGSDAGSGTGGSVVVPPPPTSQSVTQRGGGVARTGHYIRPMLTKAKAATMTTDAGFVTSYRGTLTGTPLYLENGPGGKGAFFVATQANMIYAFDETTGMELWNKSAGPTGSGGCDNMLKGIMGTPAIDPVSRTIFVSAANGGGAFSFKVHAYNVDDGTERAGWPVDLGTAVGLTPAVLSRHNQRGSLLLVNGILYVPLGGQFTDCSNARGRVVAINIADPTKIGTWSSSDDGASIWAPGGMASDGTGIFAITGNHFPNLSSPATHGDSEEIVRLTGMAQVMANDANVFYPKRWQAMDNADLDFGANSPLVMDVPGATPSRFVAGSPKDGHIYFVDPNNMGGMGGEKFDLAISNQGMSIIAAAPASYVTEKGAYIVVATQGAHCPAGGPTGTVVMGVSVPVVAGAINPTVAWCASASGGTFAGTSPAVTTTDGRKDAVVWYMTGGVLKGVDGDTGAQVYSGGACQVERWTAPIVAKGARIVAGGNGKLCSWSAR